jgi:hypothetical protein
MGRFAKSAVLLLIALMGASSLGNGWLLLNAQPFDQSAGGCHEHGSEAPSPQSAERQCCLTGHNVAVPQASHSAEPLLHNTQTELVVAVPVTSPAARHETTLISSGDPPGVTALRI